MRRHYLLPIFLSAIVSVSPTWRSSLLETFQRLPQRAINVHDPRTYYSSLFRDEALTPPLDEERRIYDSLASVLRALGEQPAPFVLPSDAAWFRYVHEELIGGQGFSLPGTGLYRTRTGLSRVNRTIALAHEMAHAQFYVKESEAEALACLALLNSKDPYLYTCGLYERLLFEDINLVSPVLQPFLAHQEPSHQTHITRFSNRLYAFLVPRHASYVDRSRELMRTLESRIGCEKISQLGHNP